jgi:hypothetical protein
MGGGYLNSFLWNSLTRAPEGLVPSGKKVGSKIDPRIFCGHIGFMDGYFEPLFPAFLDQFVTGAGKKRAVLGSPRRSNMG